MNYITKVKIENFQSHEISELEFVNGLNVIVGPSDQGKSAVIRAIKWVLFNEPRGSEFIRNGTNMARVELGFNNGYSIIRERSSSKNRYSIINPDGEVKVYEGFGNDIPDEVKAVHGITKVLIDSDSSVCLNIGEQLESAFLISETGSTKAKAIGRLTGVHVLDNAIRECINDIKKESQLVSKYKSETNELVEKLDSYKDLENLEKKINKCEAMLEKIKKLNDRHSKLDKYKLEFDRINKEINELIKINKAVINVGDAENMVGLLSNRVKYLSNLQDTYSKLANINTEIQLNEGALEETRNIEEAAARIEKAEKKKVLNEKLLNLNKKYSDINEEIELSKAMHLKVRYINKAEDMINRIILLESRKEDIRKISSSYNSIRSSIAEGEKYISKMKNELDNSINEYKDILKIISKCPVCFSNINEDTIERILKEYV
ncbi:MAG: AAA family ATPase [Ignavibacteriales bacterium]